MPDSTKQNYFIGVIEVFAFDFAPRNWAKCDGQVLPIAQNTALYSLLGDTFGGDDKTSFALPDLRGRSPVGSTEAYALGQKPGSATTTLQQHNIPPHEHEAAILVEAAAADKNNSTNNMFAGGAIYTKPDADVRPRYGGEAIMNPGGHQRPNAFNCQTPVLAVNICISMVGVYPSRN